MAFVACDKDGTEWIFETYPLRCEDESGWGSDNSKHPYNDFIELPHGSIAKLIGRELTWEDEPVELTE